MSSTATPGSKPVPKDFKGLWDEAQERYKAKSGRDLPAMDIFTSRILDPDEVIRYIDERGRAFDTYRTKGEKIRRVLRPMVDLMLPFLDAGAEGAAAVAPGGKAIFVAVGVLLQATKGVSGLYDVIEALLEKFNVYLNRIKIHLEPSTPPTPALMDIFADTLVQVLITLAIVTRHCDAVKSDRFLKDAARVLVRRAKDFVRIIMDKNDVKDALNKFEELTKEELLATAAHTNAIVRKIYDDTVLSSLRSWLRAPDPYDTYTKKRKADSCQWFFDDQFRDWQSRKDGMYWVYGRAGSGKSVLCSSVIDTLHEDIGLLLAYFYFDYKALDKQDCLALVSSLVFQIGSGFDDGIRILNEEQSRAPGHPPVYEKLLAVLSHLLGLSGRTSIVIDALDECPAPLRNADLLGFLGYLSEVQRRDDTDLRVFVVSRPEADIQNRMPHLATHVLDFADASQHADEIRAYITNQLYGREMRAYFAWSDEAKNRVDDVLMERSHGIFLWVKLQLELLEHCNEDDVDLALNELPSDLNETYERILSNFRSPIVLIERVRHVFECVAFAQRALSPAEAAEIFNLNFGSPKELPIDLTPKSLIEDPSTFVLQKCPGLLEIVIDEEGQETVQFIHLSVKEYLTLTFDKLSGTMSGFPSSLYRLDADDADVTLARICISTLLEGDDSRSIFKDYADDHWMCHVSCRIDSVIGELLYRFLHLTSGSYGSWSKRDSAKWVDDLGSALHFAARWGLCHHAERMILRSGITFNMHSIVNTRARNIAGETPLHIAARYNRSDKVACMLLDHGFLIDTRNDKGEIPLHLAAGRGHMHGVLCLLAYRAPDGSGTSVLQCSIRSSNGQTALHRAAKEVWYPADAYADICRTLIEHGCLVDDADNDGNTPLHLAVASVKPDCVRLLLDYPAADGSSAGVFRCRIRNHRGQTPLHCAADTPQHVHALEVSGTLLDHGAFVDDVDNNGDTPLHHAAAFGHSDVVRLLLEHPAADGSTASTFRCRARNQRGRTALHNSADQGNVDACRVLLEHGASVSDTDNEGNTPLSLARAIPDEKKKKYDPPGNNWRDLIRLLSHIIGEESVFSDNVDKDEV